MKKLLLVALSLALSLSLACCACLAEDEARLVLPVPQDLATLFPGDAILTKDLGDFTISYPESMEFEEFDVGEKSGNNQYVSLGGEGYYLIIHWFADSGIAYDASTTSYHDALVNSFIEMESSLMENLSKLSGGESKCSFDTSAFDLSGKTVAAILLHVDTVYVDSDARESFDKLFLLFSLDEKSAYLFDIYSEGNAVSKYIVVSSILHTVKWKE